MNQRNEVIKLRSITLHFLKNCALQLLSWASKSNSKVRFLLLIVSLQSLHFPFVDCRERSLAIVAVLALHYSGKAVSFRLNRLAQPRTFCSLACERYWD